MSRNGPAGFTIIELLTALVLVGTAVALAAPALVRLREAWLLEGAASAVQRQLHAARVLALSRRQVVRVRSDAGALLVSTGEEDSVVVRLPLGPATELPVDSIRVRPSTLRFNSRGHAAAGSLTLYRRNVALRLACNFLGRVRREPPSPVP